MCDHDNSSAAWFPGRHGDAPSFAIASTGKSRPPRTHGGSTEDPLKVRLCFKPFPGEAGTKPTPPRIWTAGRDPAEAGMNR